ncbi:MAG: sulfurtransferase-like selenium metabolism protein YedF [Candidatus Vecturithrix sp.]|nr:sulfurtransferase-like selenium metabolism protein YedF [Candidatus Vecturithrix sp.]
MAKTVDARGLACPQPVIQTRNALQEETSVITIVDNETSQSNVTKMAEKMGCTVVAEAKADGIYLQISKDEDAQPEVHPHPAGNVQAAGPLVLVIPDEFMGRGDPELGGILMRAFFHTLGEIQPLPDTIIFFNNGVKLVVEGSKVLDDLHLLKDQGITMLTCGTCLGHYGLKDQVKIGEISNMYTIAETMLGAGKVVSL